MNEPRHQCETPVSEQREDPDSSVLLTVRSLNFSYPQHRVLQDINLDLRPGQILILIGPNGSGKSTLIRALIAALRAEGAIAWNGTPIEQWKRRDLARFVAYLSQSPLYEPGQRVIDILRLGRTPYWQLFGLESIRDEQVVRAIADQLHLTEILTRPIDEISGGQRQMVFVARALVQEPRAILLDEPSTFLDLGHQVELMTLLRKLAREQNVGVLMASHDLNLAAATADELILLDRGAIAAHGSLKEVLDPVLLSRVYGVQMQRIDHMGRAPVVLPQFP